jgi:hypothetical protein
MTAETANWVGQRLCDGRFEVSARLGEGGMGFVYLAHDQQQQHDVVIKVPRQQMLDDPEFAARFQREVRSLVRLVHDHIVKVVDVGEYEGKPFAVLDFLPGGSLRDRLDGLLDARAGGRPAEELRRWLPGIAAALDFCHQNQCVHRDVKPDNILFDAAERAYLSDFGIAKVLGTGGRSKMTVMTAAGVVLGTPQYMAPEIIMGQPFDGRADQYALAVTVYEAVSGRLPIDGATPAAVMVQQTTQTPLPLDKVSRGVPRALAAAVAKALAKAPPERFRTCADFAEAALAALLPAGARPGTAAEPAVGGTLVGTPVVNCPRCKKLYRLRTEMLGKQVRCQRCDASFTVPGKKPRGDKALADTKPSRVETPRANRPALPAPRRLVLPALAVLTGFLGVLLVGGAVAAIIWWKSRTTFEVALPERVSVAPGGKADVAVTLSRGGFSGPVEVTPRDWPKHLKAEAVTVASGQDAGKLVVSATPQAAEGETEVVLTVKAGSRIHEKRLKVVVEWPVGEVRCFKGHSADVTAVALSPDGKFAASVSLAGEVCFWNCQTGKAVGTTGAGGAEATCLTFAPDGKQVLTGHTFPFGTGKAGMRLWPFGTDKAEDSWTFEGASDPVLAVAWDSANKRLVAAGRRPGRAEDRAWVSAWSEGGGPTGTARTLAFTLAAASPRGRFLLLVDNDTPGTQQVTLWSVADATDQVSLALELPACNAAAITDTGALAAFAVGDEVRLLDLKAAKAVEKGRLTAANKVVALACSPDGKRLLTGHTDGKVRLWDVASRQELRALTGHQGPARCVAFGADGRFAISGGADQTVRWWKLP